MTNVRSLSESTSPHTTRAYTLQVRGTMASMMFRKLGPRIATRLIAKKMNGMASNVSITRLQMVSLQPPKYPAVIPYVFPGSRRQPSYCLPTNK